MIAKIKAYAWFTILVYVAVQSARGLVGITRGAIAQVKNRKKIGK